MKRTFVRLFFFFAFFSLVQLSTGCSPGYGCEMNTTSKTDLSKKSKKRGNTNLFPKNMRRN